MSTHINAPKGAIAEGVLLPGDPLRAKYIAENFLENPVCYNEVRGMYGFTGTYKGKEVIKKEETSDNTLESDLFDLIDSMYEKRGDE